MTHLIEDKSKSRTSHVRPCGNRGQVMSGLVKNACLVNEKSSWMLVPVDKVNDDAYTS